MLKNVNATENMDMFINGGSRLASITVFKEKTKIIFSKAGFCTGYVR